jgi:hypothetical protein
MERRIEWTWPRRTLSVFIGAAMVLALLLVVERPSNAGAQAQTAIASTAIAQHAAPASVFDGTTAQRAVTAANALPAQLLPPAVLSRICAALLRALALVSRLGPFGAFAAAVLSRIIAAFGCNNISGA